MVGKHQNRPISVLGIVLKVRIKAKLYTPSTLNIQMKLILLWVWAEWAVLGIAKTALKFKCEIK